MKTPPEHIVAAARLVSKWFEENNIYTWALENCKNRWVRAAPEKTAGIMRDVPPEWALTPKDER